MHKKKALHILSSVGCEVNGPPLRPADFPPPPLSSAASAEIMDDIFSLDDFLLWDVNGMYVLRCTGRLPNACLTSPTADDSHFTEHEIYLASLTDPLDGSK